MDDYISFMRFAVAVSDASNQAEEARSQAAHAQTMRHYQGEQAKHQRQIAESLGKQAHIAPVHGDGGEEEDTPQQLREKIIELEKITSAIARENITLKKELRALEQAFNNFALSNQSFKDLAYDLGHSMGYAEDEVDSLYLERAQEIADGKNPHEVIVEERKPYLAEALKAVQGSVELRRQYRAQKAAQA